MTPRHILLGTSVVAAAWLALFGDKSSVADIAEPMPRAAHAAVSSPQPKKPEQEPAILALQSRELLIGGATVEKPDGEIFGSHSWTPPPPPPAKPPPPPPPTAPPLPFTYLGKKMEDGTWEVYLARGEHTLIVQAQSIIENTYRVDSIKPPTLSLTYLPLGEVQTLAIGGTD